jgi:hypothetical protein
LPVLSGRAKRTPLQKETIDFCQLEGNFHFWKEKQMEKGELYLLIYTKIRIAGVYHSIILIVTSHRKNI